MKNFISIFLFLSGCACYNTDTVFGLDGKAVSWCEREQRANKLCKKHDGLKTYYYGTCECNDGTKFDSDEMEPR